MERPRRLASSIGGSWATNDGATALPITNPSDTRETLALLQQGSPAIVADAVGPPALPPQHGAASPTRRAPRRCTR